MENISWQNREMEAKWTGFKKGLLAGFFLFGVPMLVVGYYWAMKAFTG